MSDEKQLKEPDKLAKVFLLIPTFLFIIDVVLYFVERHGDRSIHVTLRHLFGWVLILHIFPGSIFSIVGLIRTIGRKNMNIYRFLGFIQIILDLILVVNTAYAIYHA